MQSKFLKFALVLGLLVIVGGCKTSQIDEDMTGYTKPIISRINPEGIIYSNMGFVLTVYSNNFENDEYVLYLNNRKLASQPPNYWRYQISWEIPADLLREVVAAAGTGEPRVGVRITQIQTDIANNFNAYAAYISDVKELVIRRDNTEFTSPAKLSELWPNSTDPRLRIDSRGVLYLAWREKVYGMFHTFFCFSNDEGNSWSQILNISRSKQDVTAMDMATDGAGHIYMVWLEQAETSSAVYFCRSLDNGASWYVPQQVSDKNEPVRNPKIAVDMTGTLFMCWTNSTPDIYPEYDKIWVSRSTDHGDHMETGVLKENEGMGGEPVLTAGKNGNMYLMTGRDENIQTFYSLDAGLNWQVYQTHVEGYFRSGRYSSLTVGEAEKLFLIWNTQDTAGHNNNNWIHFVRGTDLGAQWNEHQYIDQICNTSGRKAALSVNGDHLAMLLSSISSLFLLRSTDAGVTWSYPEFIPGTTSTFGSVPLDMVLTPSGKIVLVYLKKTAVTDELGSIHIIRSR